MSTHQPTEPLAPVDQQPVLGLHGEPCATCGAPLAADQRYCLACGARRADARLPFRGILAAPGTPPPGATPGPATAPPPEAGGGGTGGAPAAAATTGAATGAAKTSKSSGAKSRSGSSSGKSSTPSKANNTQLKELEKLSPEQYQKKSQKLPKTVGTGGTPPPKDDKPAAGGGDFQTIG